MDRYDFMKKALECAKEAYQNDEIPVGCVIVKNNEIIATGRNYTEESNCATKHAEILAIENASQVLKSNNLSGCDLYVTLEPCPMCSGAIINSRIRKLYIGTMDEKGGAVGSKFNLLKDIKLNHTVEVESGIYKEDCSQILKDFFKELRKGEKYKKNK